MSSLPNTCILVPDTRDPQCCKTPKCSGTIGTNQPPVIIGTRPPTQQPPTNAPTPGPNPNNVSPNPNPTGTPIKLTGPGVTSFTFQPTQARE